MQAEPSFSAHMRRKRLRAYEFELARRAYAYGVDLRRTRWLTQSSLGSTLVRRVDRAWPSILDELEREVLIPAEQALPDEIVDQLDAIVGLLRCSRPVVRLVRDDCHWPLATPLAPAHGSEPWLLLNAEPLVSLDENERAFVLGSALGHLQCGHGALFAAHWFAEQRSHRLGWLRRVLAPWVSVAVFSADRAGLLACRDLDVAIATIRDSSSASTSTTWWPRFADSQARLRALEDFDRSLSMARVRAAAERGTAISGMLEHLEAELRAGQSVPDDDTEHGRSESEPRSANSTPNLATESAGDSTTAGEPSAPTDAEPPAGEPSPELSIPADAWSIARCDRRLTERLGLF